MLDARSARFERVLTGERVAYSADSELLAVFDRFHRSEHWKTSSTPGMGLGLDLAKHVIDAHGGDIWAELPEDGGTRQMFTVPAIRVDA